MIGGLEKTGAKSEADEFLTKFAGCHGYLKSEDLDAMRRAAGYCVELKLGFSLHYMPDEGFTLLGHGGGSVRRAIARTQIESPNN